MCTKGEKIIDQTVSSTAAKQSKMKTEIGHGIGKVLQEPGPCSFRGFWRLKPEKGELRESGRGRPVLNTGGTMAQAQMEATYILLILTSS